MEYYYVVKENISGDKLRIIGKEAGHLIRVLRKKTGDEIYVTDGERNLYKGRIIKAGKGIECEIIEKSYNVSELELKVTLFPALLRNPTRFEFIVEKATELGVYEIIPIITENVVARRKRQERWQSIALSAMKQSQRCYLPKVSEPVGFIEAIERAASNEAKIIAHEKGETDYKSLADFGSVSSVSVFVGPEGGFTEEEIEAAAHHGFKVLKLGERKLRSETAALVILGRLLYAG